MKDQATADRPQVGLDAGFPKGKYHVTQERDADWDEGLRPYFKYRDLGMVEATGGKVRAHVIAPTVPCRGPGDRMLKGWARVHFDGVGEIRMKAGSCMYQEPGSRMRCWSTPTTTP